MSDLAKLLQQYGYGEQPNALARDGESFDTSNVLAGMPRPNALANALQVAGVPKDEHGFLFSNVGGELKFNPYEAIKNFMGYRAPPGALSTSGDDAPVRNSAEAAGWLGLSGLGLNFAGQAPKNALGIFGGRLAKTADHNALAKAEELAAKGADRKDIWDQTGWFQGADGKWRFEIDDSGSRMGHFYTEPTHSEVVKAHVPKEPGAYIPQALDLEKYIIHPELERAYWPTREAAPSVIFDDLGSARGKYTPGNDFVTMDSASFLLPDEGRSTALHELQHAIQGREGFARGYNPVEAGRDVARARFVEQELREKTQRMQNAHGDEARDIMRRAAAGDPEAAKFVNEATEIWSKRLGAHSEDNPYGLHPDQMIAAELGERDEIFRRAVAQYGEAFKTSRLDPHDLYRMHAGEVEARNVQARRDMTAEERRARPPWETEDTPLSRQIVRDK